MFGERGTERFFTFVQVEHCVYPLVRVWIKRPVFCRCFLQNCPIRVSFIGYLAAKFSQKWSSWLFPFSSLCLMLLILLRKLCRNQTPPTWGLTPPVRLGLPLPSEQLRPQRKCVYKWETPLCDKATLDLLKSTPKCTRALSGRKTGAPFIPLGCGGEAAEGDEHPVYFKCVKCGEERQAGTTRCCLSTSSRPRSASPLQ